MASRAAGEKPCVSLRNWWAIGWLVFVLFAPALAAAQEPEPAAATETGKQAPAAGAMDFSQPMGPPDPFNRGTPRGSMYGYLAAARKGDYARAAEFLDLRRLPPEERESGEEYARQFKVVLDRNIWIDLINLSDSNNGRTDDSLPEWQDRLGDALLEGERVPLLLQRIPRADDGTRIWVVSGSTVERIPEIYAAFEPVWFEAYLPKWMVDRYILEVPAWRWLSLILLALGSWIVSMGLARVGTQFVVMLSMPSLRSVEDQIALRMRAPAELFWFVMLFGTGRRSMGLAITFADRMLALERAIFVIAFAWILIRLADLWALALFRRQQDQGLVDGPAPFNPVARFVKVIVVVIGVIGVLAGIGVDVTAALAGLGIGGIAIALAAQKSLENLIGGFNLLADQPARIGEFLRYGESIGTLEEIGLRSTRIRTLDRTIVTIPNSEFSNLRIENYAKRDRMRITALIGVRYETTPDQLRYLLTRLREVLYEHPRILPDPSRVRFFGFGAYSLDIDVLAYVDTDDWSDFLAVREDIYFRFMDVILESGTSFAFPSSTTYVAPDHGLDPKTVANAEAQVAHWREQGQLPFPNVPDERLAELENRGDWPPVGSPGTEKP